MLAKIFYAIRKIIVEIAKFWFNMDEGSKNTASQKEVRMGHRNIAAERVRAGMTQRELAAALGCGLGTIVRIEKNASQASSDLLDRAAEFFGCTVDYLMDRTEERR